MPALTIPSPTAARPTPPSDISTPAPVPPAERDDTTSRQANTEQETPRPRSRSQSPDRPPVSPITPTVSVAQLAPIDPLEARKHVLPPPLATFRPKPPPVAISESDNPDAIALRSAISLLQLQKEKSRRDLKILEDLKTAAIADPQGFVRSIQEQRRKPAPTVADPLSATLSDISSPALSGSGVGSDEGGNARKDSGAVPTSERDTPFKFAPIPQPQNIIRCPPINWDKYHIVGEPLDKMHEEQKRWPGSREPPRTASGARAPPHAVAAPYSPFTDGYIEPQPPNANGGSKKPPS